jgi:hypothetical protein
MEEADSYRYRQSQKDREYVAAYAKMWKELPVYQRVAMREAGLEVPHFDDLKDHLSALPAAGEQERARQRKALRMKRLKLARKNGGAGVVSLSEDAADSAVSHETAVDVLEPLDGEETAATAKTDVAAWQFLLMGRFICEGAEDFDTTKIRALIMLRTMAPDVLWSRFAIRANEALKLEEKLRNGQPWYFRNTPYMPLSELVAGNANAAEAEAAAELGLGFMEFRALRIGEFCDLIGDMAGGGLDAFVKTLASMLRRVKAGYVSGLGDSQTALGGKFGEGRATQQAREKRTIEEPLRAAGMLGFHLGGGTKTGGHRDRCAKAQRGNRNRIKGKLRGAGAE